MTKVFSEDAWADYLHWQNQDRRTLRRVNLLIRETERSPFEGIGKPEPLKHNLSGWWSRRIDEKNRMVYRVREQGEHRTLEIASLRYHY
jgi:toxin YoeB